MATPRRGTPGGPLPGPGRSAPEGPIRGSETAESGAAHLIVQLNMIVGLSDGSDEIPREAFTAMGGTVQTVDAEETWDVETRDGFAGVTKAAGVPVFRNGQPYTGPVTIFIAPIEPSESNFSDFGLQIGGPDRGAFPLFKDIGTIPGGLQFGNGNISEDESDPTNEIVVELCIVDPPHPLAPFPSQLPDLRVGHIVNGETLEVAPLAGSTLDCTGVNDEVPIAAMFQNRWHRWANVALGPTAQLFDVAKLHAQPGALGGRISAFSEFGGIDTSKTQPPVTGPIAYVAGDFGITVIDVTNNIVLRRIFLPGGLYDVSFSPDGETAYAVGWMGGAGHAYVIDVSTHTLVTTITVRDRPVAVAITPDGSTAYVGHDDSGGITVIDVASSSVVDTITFPPPGCIGAWDVIFTPATFPQTFALVACLASDAIYEIDVATNTVVGFLGDIPSPEDFAIGLEGPFLVTNYFEGTLTILTETVIDVGELPEAVALSPDESIAYVVNDGSNDVYVIDLVTNTLVKVITVGSGPWAVDFTADGTVAYVANSDSGTISVIDVQTHSVVTTIDVDVSNLRSVDITP